MSEMEALIAAETLSKKATKFDCLKTTDVLGLESFEFSAFHLLALILFVIAIVHTFSTNAIRRHARNLEMQIPHQKETKRDIWIQFLYFFAEVEVVFALWAIPLFLIIATTHGWNTALEYLNTRDFTRTAFCGCDHGAYLHKAHCSSG